jgi:hypothetical protein
MESLNGIVELLGTLRAGGHVEFIVGLVGSGHQLRVQLALERADGRGTTGSVLGNDGESGAGSDIPEERELASYREPVFELGNAAPPRIGSTNAAVWTLLKHLPSPFTREQFEAVIPKATRYDAATGEFGISTRWRNIKLAKQGYFSEFKKRGWIVPVHRAEE